MWRLAKYLEENQISLVETVDIRDNAYLELAEKLSEIRPGDRKNNAELVDAVITALWLGGGAQMIKESGDKSA